MIGVSRRARRVRDARAQPLRRVASTTSRPAPDDLAQIDVLVIDLQDVGARYYTFVWTAVLAMRACARAGVRVLVLDRPNPLGGDLSRIEGRRQSRACCSFVGLEPVPVRHSLTLGEIVAWRAEVERRARRARCGSSASRGSSATSTRPAWDRPFVAPSPNMPDVRDRARLSRRLPRRRDQPLRGARHDAPVRDRRGALDRRREARRRAARARAAGDARAAAHVSAGVSEARGQGLRGRPDPRDRSERVPARGDLPGARHARALRRRPIASRSGPRSTSFATTFRRSIC